MIHQNKNFDNLKKLMLNIAKSGIKQIPADRWEATLDEIVENMEENQRLKTIYDLFAHLRSTTENYNRLTSEFFPEGSKADLKKVAQLCDRQSSIWLHSELEKDIVIPPGADHHQFFAKKIIQHEKMVTVLAHNNIMLNITGTSILLCYLAEVLPDFAGKTEHEILHGVPVPASSETFKSMIIKKVTQQKRLQDEIEKISSLIRAAI